MAPPHRPSPSPPPWPPGSGARFWQDFRAWERSLSQKPLVSAPPPVAEFLRGVALYAKTFTEPNDAPPFLSLFAGTLDRDSAAATYAALEDLFADMQHKLQEIVASPVPIPLLRALVRLLHQGVPYLPCRTSDEADDRELLEEALVDLLWAFASAYDHQELLALLGDIVLGDPDLLGPQTVLPPPLPPWVGETPSSSPVLAWRRNALHAYRALATPQERAAFAHVALRKLPPATLQALSFYDENS